MRQNKVKSWVLYRKNRWGKEGHLLMLAQDSVALWLQTCLSLQTLAPSTAEPYWPWQLAFSFLFQTLFLPSFSYIFSCLLFISSLRPLFLLSSSMAIHTWANQWLTNVVASIISGALLFPLSSLLLLLYKNCYFLSISVLNVAWLMFLFSLHK